MVLHFIIASSIWITNVVSGYWQPRGSQTAKPENYRKEPKCESQLISVPFFLPVSNILQTFQSLEKLESSKSFAEKHESIQNEARNKLLSQNTKLEHINEVIQRFQQRTGESNSASVLNNMWCGVIVISLIYFKEKLDYHSLHSSARFLVFSKYIHMYTR